MTNQLTLLPPETTWSDVQRIVATLPYFPPESLLTAFYDLRFLHAQIFVGGTATGKSTLLRQAGLASLPPLPAAPTNERVYGVLDDSGQLSDADLMRTMVSMLKHARTQKYYTPQYKPIIFLRSSTWGRIQANFPWLAPELVSHYRYPVEAYAQSLQAAGVPEWLVRGYLGPNWTDQFVDARGQFLPQAAWRATLALADGTSLTGAKTQAVVRTGLELVQQSPTLQMFAQHLPTVMPDDVRQSLQGKHYQITKARLNSRLLTAMRAAPLPGGMTRTQYLRAAEHEGIVKKRPQGQFVFSHIHAAGYAKWKQLLTLGHVYSKGSSHEHQS